MPVLPLVAFVGVLFAVGFAVTRSRLTITAESPAAVAVPIRTPKEPAPSERAPDRAPARIRVPKDLQLGMPSNPGTQPSLGSIAPSQPAPVNRSGAAIETLRAENGVRALTRGPTGIRAAQMPQGTFGFIPMDSVTMLQSASVEETPLPGAFEVHRTNTGHLVLFGYAHPATVKAIHAGVRVNAILSPSAVGVRTQLASIPFNQISNAELRMDAGNKVLLLELAATAR